MILFNLASMVFRGFERSRRDVLVFGMKDMSW